MAHIIATAITFILSNYALTFFAIGLLFSAAAIIRLPRPLSAGAIVEKLLAWHVFFAIGISFLWNFVIHVFFGELAARFIGWADSPFQFEVGTASLGFAAVGFLAAFGNFELRLGAILGSALFALGAAVGHIHQMVTAHNFAPGNAGAAGSCWSADRNPFCQCHLNQSQTPDGHPSIGAKRVLGTGSKAVRAALFPSPQRADDAQADVITGASLCFSDSRVPG